MSYVIAFILPDPEHSAPARTALVIGYLASAWFWCRAGLRARETTPDGPIARCWMWGAFLLLLLAVNKAFDLRVHCEALIRMIAKATGWYEQRQPAQFFFAIVLPTLAGLMVLALVLTFARKFVRDHPLALAGWFLLLLYLALRQMQEWKPALNWLESVNYLQWRLALEVIGIVLVLAAARKPLQAFTKGTRE